MYASFVVRGLCRFSLIDFAMQKICRIACGVLVDLHGDLPQSHPKGSRLQGRLVNSRSRYRLWLDIAAGLQFELILAGVGLKDESPMPLGVRWDIVESNLTAFNGIATGIH